MRYPDTVDAAVNGALRALRVASPDPAPAAPTLGEGGQAGGPAQTPSNPSVAEAHRVAAFVSAALGHGLRAPLGAADRTAGFTVQQAIDAPAAELRMLVRAGLRAATHAKRCAACLVMGFARRAAWV